MMVEKEPVDVCCCGCCSRKTGTKLIGWTYLVLSIIFLALSVFMTVCIDRPRNAEDVAHNQQVYNFGMTMNYFFGGEGILAICLLVGVYKNKYCPLVHGWIYANALMVPAFTFFGAAYGMPRICFYIGPILILLNIYYTRVVAKYHLGRCMCTMPVYDPVLRDIA